MQKRKQRILTLITLILSGETIFFLPFVLARVYRPVFLESFQISNVELGSFFSTFGIVATISYFFGGPLADRFQSKYLISIALALTGLGGFYMATIPGVAEMRILFGYWGLTCIMLFWAALIRSTREWGSNTFQGRAFGWLEGGRGATAAILASLTLLLFSSSHDNAATEVFNSKQYQEFQNVILFSSMFTILVSILAFLFIPLNTGSYQSGNVSVSQIKELLKRPKIWILSFIIICAYSGYKITDDFSLYANEVLGFSTKTSAAIAAYSLYTRALVAVVAGVLADKFLSSKVVSFSFVISLLGGIFVASGWIEHHIIITLINMLMVMIGVYSIRALYFALVHEANVPIYLTGTTVGLVSILGYAPDIYMSPLMGYLLDANPGINGHRHVFMVLVGFSTMGFMASLAFTKSK